MKTSLLLLLTLPISAFPLAGQDEKPFQAVPIYKASAFAKEDEVGDRKLIQLDKATIDGISGFVQGFYGKYNSQSVADMLSDGEITSFLSEDYVQRLKRAHRVAKVSGDVFYIPGHSSSDDLYKYTASFTTGEKDQYIIDAAVGSSTSDEIIYSHHIWIVVKKHGDSWLITDLRDMGNG